LAIFAFDAFVENPDRKPSNPNLLVKGDEFRIIDHELALFVRGLLPRPAPWQAGYLNHMMGPDSHVFAARLRGVALDLDAIRAAWSSFRMMISRIMRRRCRDNGRRPARR
jgi:hypothetical protein